MDESASGSAQGALLQRAIPRSAGIVGAALGVVAAGTAVGIAVERFTIGRAVRRMAEIHDPGDAFGTLRGVPQTVMAADGTELYVEVDDPFGWPRTVDWRRAGRRVPATRAGRPGLREFPTLLFTHGFCLPQDCWHHQRAEFSGEYRMVFWDQRGHGRSDRLRPDTELSVEVTGEDLYAVIEATCPTGPIILIGHSMGGMTMMALAETHPELFGDRIVGVALMSTSAGEISGLEFGLPRLAAKLFHRTAPGMFDLLTKQRALVERGRRAGGDVGLVLTRRYAFGSDAPESVVRFVQELIESTPIEVIARFFTALRVHDKTDALPVFDRVPALVLAADHDLLLPLKHSRAMADAIPDADFVIVQDAGHVVILEHPDEVNSALRRLVDRVEARLDESSNAS
ncbi:MAG TPA: alpha/beta hydrolase [Actinocrinis sp.]|uniref:alpha/beta fold hydrolase n=1 Tax=Actinocrinis sp. TaxID=1920516 RepID=UPI002DDD4D8A|nr:alpha/beta hydrolase [Actinocrinis sp.]HEV2346959.1 alpha/beta hydrolase [Actinocrinis sp.]